MLQLPETEKSLWQEIYLEGLYPELLEDLEVDVAIVGGGITGLTSAYLLKQAGLKVAVIEKATIGGGTTGRTTGKVTSQHNLVYADLQQRLGTETAQLYGEANQAAVEQVESIVKREKISCDWERQDNYVYTTSREQVKQFKQEAKVAAQLGMPASFETTSPLPFAISAAVRFSQQGRMHSQRYLMGLAAAIQGDGSYIFEQSNVIGIRDGAPARVKTKHAKVLAKDVIVATNVPTLPLAARGGYCLLEYPIESYLVAGKLDIDYRGMYISPDDNHFSILPTQVDGQSLLLVGGKGHISGLRGSTRARYQQLADYAEEFFGVTKITHRWSDRDYLAYDNVPLVGKLYPWSKHVYVASAFRKWGLSNGTAAAMILRDLIIGQANPWAKIYDSTRSKPIRSIPRVAVKYLLGKS
jgi:glycine/D-amino acid oxidase-like deaminating enzyme